MNTRLKQGLHAVGIAAVLVLGLTAGAAAEAGGRVSIGIGVGGPYWGWGYARPWYGGYYGMGYGYGYPYGYGYGYGYPYSYPATVIVHQPAPTVVAPSAAQQAATWYYCHDAQMYYPYVTSCPSAWQEVPATPPPAPAGEMKRSGPVPPK
jgi:hypothetical protein